MILAITMKITTIIKDNGNIINLNILSEKNELIYLLLFPILYFPIRKINKIIQKVIEIDKIMNNISIKL